MSVLGRIARRIGGKEWFLRLIPVIVPFDRAIGSVTKGRISAMNIPDLPTFLLTTVGRKTGQRRTQPLLFAYDGDGFAIAGSNFGKPNHPASSGNLIAQRTPRSCCTGRSLPYGPTWPRGWNGTALSRC